MPDLSVLLLFSAACFALTMTPGPDMLLIASRSAAQGRKAGFLTYAGIAAGCYCHGLAVALGLAQLFTLVPLAYDIVRYAGAAYLIYLAVQTVRAGSSATDASAAPTPMRKRRVFRDGFITNVLNPKVALFMLALFPQFLDPAAGSLFFQTMLLVTILNVIGFGVNGAVIMASGYFFKRLRSNGQGARWPKYLLASVFTGLAARLAFDTRN